MKKIIAFVSMFAILGSTVFMSMPISAEEINTYPVTDDFVNDVEAVRSYTTVEDLSQQDYEVILEYIGDIKGQATPYITYSDNLVPQISETLYLDIPGHNVSVFQNGNDIALSFDNINTYLIEHEATYTPSDPVVTPTTSSWVWMSHVTITNKDWIVPVKILNSSVGLITYVAPAYMKVPFKIVHRLGKAVVSYGERQVTHYGSQDRYKDKYCSQSWKYVTKWYANVTCGSNGEDVYLNRITNENGSDFITTSYVGGSVC